MECLKSNTNELAIYGKNENDTDFYRVISMKGMPPGGTWWRSWLRHGTTNRRVTGSISNGVIGIFP